MILEKKMDSKGVYFDEQVNNQLDRLLEGKSGENLINKALLGSLSNKIK